MAPLHGDHGTPGKAHPRHATMQQRTMDVLHVVFHFGVRWHKLSEKDRKPTASILCLFSIIYKTASCLYQADNLLLASIGNSQTTSDMVKVKVSVGLFKPNLFLSLSLSLSPSHSSSHSSRWQCFENFLFPGWLDAGLLCYWNQTLAFIGLLHFHNLSLIHMTSQIWLHFPSYPNPNHFHLALLQRMLCLPEGCQHSFWS